MRILLYAIGALDKFGFNAVRVSLVLYLTRSVQMSDSKAFEMYGVSMSLAFLTPLLGGFLADKLLGEYLTLICGAIFSTLGIFCLLDSHSPVFFSGLSCLILGSGLIKVCVPSMLGQTLPANKDASSIYSSLYLSFNLGTFFSVIACAVMGEILGWQYTFLIAGMALWICVALSVWTFMIKASERSLDFNLNKFFVMLSLFLLIPIINQFFNRPRILEILLIMALVVSVCWMLYMKSFYLVFLMLCHTLFFSLYEQGGLSLTLFTERNVLRNISSFIPGVNEVSILGVSLKELPVTFFQSIDPFVNIFLGGLFVYLWVVLERKNRSLSFISKFAIGLLPLGIGFFILSQSCQAGLVSPWRVILVYFFFVLGEQFTVPVGFSAAHALSPKKYKNIFMGIWFLAISASVWLANLLSQVTSSAGEVGLTSEETFQIYQKAFTSWGQIPIYLGLSILFILLLYKKESKWNPFFGLKILQFLRK